MKKIKVKGPRKWFGCLKFQTLTLRKNIDVLLKSSIKWIKYFDPNNNDVDIGPHKSVCISCDGDVLNEAILRNLSLVCLL